jgi:hypothetical protein
MERDNLEDLHIDGRILLKLVFKNWDGYTDWIHLAWWQALVNATMSLWVPQNAGSFSTSREPVSL